MKLTENVKKYIEDNIQLIDNTTDLQDVYEFLDSFDVTTGVCCEDLACILEVLCTTLSVLPDMRKYINNYKKEIDLAYDSVKSINILNISPELNTYWDCTNNTGWAMVNSYVALRPPTGSKTSGLAYVIDVPEINNKVYWTDSGYISLADQDSAAFKLSVNFSKFPPSEFYKKEQLNKFLNEYKNYIKELYDKVYLLEKSVEWKATAHTVAKELSHFIQKTVSKSGIECYVIIYDLSEFAVMRNELKLEVPVPIKTKIDLNITIPYDSDPKNIDVNSLMTNWKKNFEKYVKLNKHKF